MDKDILKYLAKNNYLKEKLEVIDNLIKITISEQKKKDAKIYAFPGNLLEAYDILKGDKISKDK